MLCVHWQSFNYNDNAGNANEFRVCESFDCGHVMNMLLFYRYLCVNLILYLLKYLWMLDSYHDYEWLLLEMFNVELVAKLPVRQLRTSTALFSNQASLYLTDVFL